MRRTIAVGLCMLSMASGTSLVACFDLFHSTAGILTACQIDAEACVEASTPDASTDFCAWTPQQARANAAHACAWLGACESPLGSNAFGDCMFHALLAYDCTANPNHPAEGPEHARWDCLWQVQSCGDVDSCVFLAGVPTCGTPGDYTSCASVGGAEGNRDVRVECVDGGRAHGESCTLEGQTCAADPAGTPAICAGASGDAGVQCGPLGCDGTHLHWCEDGGDVGIDCLGNGAQSCSGFPAVMPSWVACVAQGDAGCDASLSAQCQDGYSYSCPSGVVEKVDCQEILQVSGANCVSGTLSPPFDWTSPCQASPPQCSSDACDGGLLAGCTRGAPFTASCAEQGLGDCRLVHTNVGSETHAACSPP